MCMGQGVGRMDSLAEARCRWMILSLHRGQLGVVKVQGERRGRGFLGGLEKERKDRQKQDGCRPEIWAMQT
jgi:hypothetical protein